MRADIRLTRLQSKLEIMLWASLIPWLARARDLTPVLQAVEPAGTGLQGLSAQEIVAEVQSYLRRPRLMRKNRCLREGLLAYRMLKRAGHRPQLHFGVERASVRTPALSAHCWISVDGDILLNAPPDDFVEIYRFGATP